LVLDVASYDCAQVGGSPCICTRLHALGARTVRRLWSMSLPRRSAFGGISPALPPRGSARGDGGAIPRRHAASRASLAPKGAFRDSITPDSDTGARACSWPPAAVVREVHASTIHVPRLHDPRAKPTRTRTRTTTTTNTSTTGAVTGQAACRCRSRHRAGQEDEAAQDYLSRAISRVSIAETRPASSFHSSTSAGCARSITRARSAAAAASPHSPRLSTKR